MLVKLAQITDTHLFPDRDATLRGVATWHSLRAVVDRVRQENPDAIVLSGDLANDGNPDAYDLLYELIAPLGVPIYWAPGNHDRLDVARDRLDRAPFVTTDFAELGSWNLILLDSTFSKARFGEGELSAAALARLEIQLDRDRPTAIALHHHPIPMGIDWVDTIGVTNATDFHALLYLSPNAQLVLFVHTHLEFAGDRDGIRYYGTPSSCTQVVLSEDKTPADSPLRLPGFRLLELRDDGTHASKVVRVADALVRS